MDWVPLVSTTVGAAIALGGTVLADVFRSRDTRERDELSTRKDVYLQLTLAHGQALQRLREVATSTPVGERRIVIDAAMADSGIYMAREKLLMAAPRWVLRPAEVAFERLITVRNVVRGGAKLADPDYHDAYHPYAESMWALRNAIRSDLGSSRVQPSDLARESWENRETCQACAARSASVGASGNP